MSINPVLKKKDEEKVLGTIYAESTKRYFMAMSYYHKKGLKFIKKGTKATAEDVNHISTIKTKMDLASDLFWFDARKELKIEDPSIGIRRNWEVVSLKSDPSGAIISEGLILASILGGKL